MCVCVYGLIYLWPSLGADTKCTRAAVSSRNDKIMQENSAAALGLPVEYREGGGAHSCSGGAGNSGRAPRTHHVYSASGPLLLSPAFLTLPHPT